MKNETNNKTKIEKQKNQTIKNCTVIYSLKMEKRTLKYVLENEHKLR